MISARQRRSGNLGSILLLCLLSCSGEYPSLQGTPAPDAGDQPSVSPDDTGAAARDTSVEPVDLDGDGQTTAEGDCDDGNAAVYAGASELCDGLDNDCNGETDEDARDAGTWYTDADGDGYGAPESAVLACEAPTEAVSNGSDCDDGDPGIRPGATETMCDGVDSDCDADGVPEVAFVGDEGFTSVNDAAAAALDLGETAWVCPGRHEARIVVDEGETLELASWSGSASDTVLDGSNAWTILALMPGSMATLSNLGLENGEGELWSTADSPEAGAVYVSEATLELLGCELRNNHAGYSGGAISAMSDGSGSVDQAELWVQDSVFEQNSADHIGGAIYTDGYYYGYGRYTFVDTSFRDNTAGSSGAAMNVGDRTVVDLQLERTTIEDNESRSEAALGLGSFYSRFTVQIDSSNILNNTSTAYAEITVSTWAEQVDMVIEDSVINGNARGGVGFAQNVLSGSILSSNTDWGEGPTDNGGGDDVYFSGYYTFDGIVDFECTLEARDGTPGCATTE